MAKTYWKPGRHVSAHTARKDVAHQYLTDHVLSTFMVQFQSLVASEMWGVAKNERWAVLDYDLWRLAADSRNRKARVYLWLNILGRVSSAV